MHAEELGAVFGLEGGFPGEEVEEDAGEGVDVGFGGGGFGGDDFGGHVGGCADGAFGDGKGIGGVVDAGEAEVGDFAASGAGEHEVFGFDVAVGDAKLGGVGEGFGGFGGELAGAEEVEGSAGFDHGAEGTTLDEFHGNVVVAGDIADFVDLDDGGVFEFGGGAGFADELFGAVGFGGFVGAEDFECDVAFEFGVFGAEDFAHGAFAEGGEEAEFSEQDGFGFGGCGGVVGGGVFGGRIAAAVGFVWIGFVGHFSGPL